MAITNINKIRTPETYWEKTSHASYLRNFLSFSCLVVPTLGDPIDCSTPGFPVLHHLLEFVQTHFCWVSDAIEPSHPLLSPCCPAFRLSQCHGFYQWVGFSHQVAKVSEPQLQHQSFQWIFRINFLFNWLVWSSCSSRDSQESPPAPQFERIISLVLSLLYGPILTSVHDYWKKT